MRSYVAMNYPQLRNWSYSMVLKILQSVSVSSFYSDFVKEASTGTKATAQWETNPSGAASINLLSK